jgi:hypothetical protein
MLKKQSYFHAEQQEVLKAIARHHKLFRKFFCVSCTRDDVTNLTLEHLQPKSENEKFSLYLACAKCNNNKAKISAEKFYSRITHVFDTIARLDATETSELDVIQATVEYLTECIKTATSTDIHDITYNLSSRQMFLLGDVQVRKHFQNFDFSGCRLMASEKSLQDFAKKFDIGNFDIVITDED